MLVTLSFRRLLLLFFVIVHFGFFLLAGLLFLNDAIPTEQYNNLSPIVVLKCQSLTGFQLTIKAHSGNLNQPFGLVKLGEEWIGEKKLFQGLLVLNGP
jgi:hypothetical protein